MPWLIALLVMSVFTGLWYQYEAKAQQRIDIARFAATLQLSIRPLLRNDDYDWLKAQLSHIGHSSGLAVTAIAIFDQNHRLMLATDTPAILQQFTAETMLNGYTLLSYQNQFLAVQPITPAEADPVSGISLRPGSGPYYLVLAIDNAVGYGVWLVPVMIVGLIGGLVLLLWQHRWSQLIQRLHTDLSLLTHKLNQLRHGQLNVRVDEQLVPELTPVQQGFNELAQAQADKLQQLQSALQQQQQHNVQLQQQHDVLQQQCQQLQGRCQQMQQQIALRLQHIHQLQRQQHELPEQLFAQYLAAQLLLLQLDTGPAMSDDSRVQLTALLAGQLPQFDQLLADHNVTLQLFEGADNPGFELTFCPQLLQTLLCAMLQLGCRSTNVTEISLKVQLDSTATVLRLNITNNGDGIAKRVRQLLQGQDTSTLQWHESDIAIVMAVKQQLNATLLLQSLDGLGGNISLAIPVHGLSELPRSALQHVLLFDSQSSNLQERSNSLAALAAHVAKCSDLSELTMKSGQYLYDVAIIFLPEPAQLSVWHQVLQDLSSRGKVLCYAVPAQLAVWQEALKLPVTSSPFVLAQVLDATEAGTHLAKLLVVDDNPTNLAFVRVLLKQHPLQLFTASCGTEALTLCRQQRFDVILLDIQLPDIDGTEVARRLRQTPEYQHTPILAFTAHALDDEVQLFLQAGMNDVIIKPLEAAKLQHILRWCSSAVKTDSIT